MKKKTNEEKAIEEIKEALDAPLSDFKARINAMIDADVLQELKNRAKKKGIKYQTLLNQILRDYTFPQKDPIDEIKDRLARLEEKVW